MNLICKLFGHNNIKETITIDHNNNTTGKYVCKRCKIETGGFSEYCITKIATGGLEVKQKGDPTRHSC